MHRSAVKVNDVSHNYNFQRVFNLCNAHKNIGSCNFVQNAFLCSLGIQLADNINYVI